MSLTIWIAIYAVAILFMAYAFALDHQSGRWQAFLAMPLFLGLLITPVVLLILRRTSVPAAIVLAVLGLTSVVLAKRIEAALRPLASLGIAQDAETRRMRDDATRAAHEKDLRQAFSASHRVKHVSMGYVILEDGYSLALNIRGVTPASQENYYAALERALAGQLVTVQLAPQFTDRYIPSARSGVTSRYRGMQPGGRYGDVPAIIQLNGHKLSRWQDGNLIWEVGASKGSQ